MLTGVLVGLAGSATGVVLLLGGLGSSRGGASAADGATSTPTPSTSVVPFTASAADTLSRQLASGDDAQLRVALGVPAGRTLDSKAAGSLAELTPITFDTATLAVTGPRTATVVGRVAHPPKGQPATWTFQLLLIDGTWRVLGAEPAP